MLTYIAKLLFDSFDTILAKHNAIHLYFHKGLCVFVNKKVLQKGVKKVSTFNTQ